MESAFGTSVMMMDAKPALKFEGNLRSVCDFLQSTGAFSKDVQELLHKVKVTGIESDSRKLEPGFIYYAKRGENYDPFLHLAEIKAKGAIAVVIDPQLKHQISTHDEILNKHNISESEKEEDKTYVNELMFFTPERLNVLQKEYELVALSQLFGQVKPYRIPLELELEALNHTGLNIGLKEINNSYKYRFNPFYDSETSAFEHDSLYKFNLYSVFSLYNEKIARVQKRQLDKLRKSIDNLFSSFFNTKEDLISIDINNIKFILREYALCYINIFDAIIKDQSEKYLAHNEEPSSEDIFEAINSAKGALNKFNDLNLYIRYIFNNKGDAYCAIKYACHYYYELEPKVLRALILIYCAHKQDLIWLPDVSLNEQFSLQEEQHQKTFASLLMELIRFTPYFASMIYEFNTLGVDLKDLSKPRQMSPQDSLDFQAYHNERTLVNENWSLKQYHRLNINAENIDDEDYESKLIEKLNHVTREANMETYASLFGIPKPKSKNPFHKTEKNNKDLSVEPSSASYSFSLHSPGFKSNNSETEKKLIKLEQNILKSKNVKLNKVEAEEIASPQEDIASATISNIQLAEQNLNIKLETNSDEKQNQERVHAYLESKKAGEGVITKYIDNQEAAILEQNEIQSTLEAQACLKHGLLCLVIPSHKTLSALAGFIYDNPSHKLRLIGVTGTNGKSTTTNLIAQMLNSFGHKCAVFGTLGYGFLDNLQQAQNTTLDAISLQRNLAHCVEQGADYAVLEVSSIGFCEGRVSALKFAACAFSNLSRDHLDYHGNMENYYLAKSNFLNMANHSNIIINTSTKEGAELKENLANVFEVKVDSTTNNKKIYNPNRRLVLRKINYLPQSLELFFEGQDNKSVFRGEIKLLGAFNAENFALAMGVLCALGIDKRRILNIAPNLKAVKGRMECFSAPHCPRMIVDYAHTPDGIEKALMAASNHTKNSGRIIAIVGCGGDRDRGKRPLMAMKASVFADYCIFTADNPRTETLDSILDDMLLSIIPSPEKIRQSKSFERLFALTKELYVSEAEKEAADKSKGKSIEQDENLQDSQVEDESLRALGMTVLTHSKKYRQAPQGLYFKTHALKAKDVLPFGFPSVNNLSKNALVIKDRYQAIRFAFEYAHENDCIVICGKGHEDYQIFSNQTIHFSDREVCRELLGLKQDSDYQKVGAHIQALSSKSRSISKSKTQADVNKRKAKNPTKASSALKQKMRSTKASEDNKMSKSASKTSTKRVKATTKSTSKASLVPKRGRAKVK